MHININFIDAVIGHLIGGADDDEQNERYRHLNPNDESQVKNVIRNVIKPSFDIRPDKYKNMVKFSLAYYLTTDKEDFGRHYDSLLLAFDHPDDPKMFYIWIWEVLFGNESYELKNWQDYEEIDDCEEPGKYYR